MNAPRFSANLEFGTQNPAHPHYVPEGHPNRAAFLNMLKGMGVQLIHDRDGYPIGFDGEDDYQPVRPTVRSSVRFAYSPPTLTRAVPYGVEIKLKHLKAEWLKPGDIHLIRTTNRTAVDPWRRADLSVHADGRLYDGRQRVSIRYIDFVVLYPAPQRHPFLSEDAGAA
ncbi:hypothetical protein Q1W73_16620 [Asticcacaulis sp. ZE23SCel15]|uniref:hypothetical protein n=1 Tax=Asticcacaulis sp. ZE23SCel15 TaxID=3059027 RepID=UPI00265F93B6|nr:hypothetical protein [Asticcacaulis sp. ZE23SCel15]WKL57268.1 hypothetical protein Q1W73_16620 [Asticcacaulis sp. ZE23SCel15]